MGQTNFPTSLDSHTGADPFGFGEIGNGEYTALTADASTSSTAFSVGTTAAFASRGLLICEDEVFSYTGKTSTSFTGVSRGVDGTSVAAHKSGRIVGSAPIAANHNDLAAALVAVETQLGARLAYLTRKNRVINGDMRVAQRTTLGSTDDTYTLDRWNLLLESAGGWTVTRETTDVPTNGSKYALKLTADGNDTKGGVATYLEFLDVADLRGKTVSLQANLKVSNARIGDVRMAVLEWTGTADSVTSDVVGTWGSAGTNPTLATSWAYLGTPANLSVTTSQETYRAEGLTVGASANNLAVFIWVNDESNDSGDYLVATDIQLEEGPTCSGFERRPYQDELTRCQRYYYRYSSEPIGLAYTITILTTDNCQLLPVPMRASPSISGATFAVNAGSAGTVAAVAASNRVLRFYNSDSNWTVNALVSVTADVSAEL